MTKGGMTSLGILAVSIALLMTVPPLHYATGSVPPHEASIPVGKTTHSMVPEVYVQPNNILFDEIKAALPAVNSTIGVNYQASSDKTAQNEPGIAVNPTNPRDIIVSGNDYDTAATGSGGGSWASEFTSLNGGSTWSYHPAAMNNTFSGGKPCFGGDTNVFFDSNGTAYFAGLGYPSTQTGRCGGGNPTNGGLFVAHSTNGGLNWTYVKVEQDFGSNWVDKEWMAVNPATGVISIDVMNYSATSFIDYWYSADGGNTWKGPTVVNSASDQNMVAAGLAVDYYGGVDIIWQGGVSGNDIEFSRATAPGKAFSAEALLGTLTCAPAGSSGFPAINGVGRMNCFPQIFADDFANSPYHGSLYVVYTTNVTSLQEKLLYSRNNGSSWNSPAISVNNDPSDGADHWFPQGTVGKNGTVFVEFLDRRYNAGNLLVDTTVGVSLDGGATFPVNVRVSSVSGNPDVWTAFMGDYQNTYWSSNGTFSVWTDFRNGVAGNGNEDLYVGQLAWMDLFTNISGVNVTIDGKTLPLPKPPSAGVLTKWWTTGTIHNISVPATVISGGKTYYFVQWQGDLLSTSAALTNVRMNGSASLHALYSLTQEPPPLFIGSFTASPNPVNVSTKTTLSVVASMGITPYSYAYAGLPPGCASSNTANLACTPSTIGTYNVTAIVTDANGFIATKTLSLKVWIPPVPKITSFYASPNPVTVNTATTFFVTVSGGTAPYSYAYSSLPPGCSSSNTATLSCTPTSSGNYSVVVTVTDANSQTATSKTVLTVNAVSPLAIVAFTASPNPVTANSATSLSVQASGGVLPYRYVYTNLPAPCTTLNTATLSCTPTSAGVYNVTVTVTDGKNSTATKTITLTVNPASTPTITSFFASPNPVTVNTSTSFSATVTGGTTPYTYSYTGLPAGCASSNTASLPCKPTVAGIFNVTVTATDSKNNTASRSTLLTVNSLLTITAFSASPNPVTVGSQTSFSLTVTGGTTPYTYAYTGLPAGCSSANTASLKCTPTATGNFSVTATVTDASSKTATRVTTLTVNPTSVPTISAFSASPNPVTVNATTSFSVSVTGGTAPYSYVYTGLPTGCSSSSTPALSCTPTTSGLFNVTVTVKDANSKTASKTLPLTVNPASVPTITAFSASPNPVTVNTATTFYVTVSGGTAPVSYAYTGLPPSCTTSNTATLSCTPTSTGTYSVTVTVTDAAGKTASSSTSLTVNSAGVPTITAFSASPDPVVVNSATSFSATVTGGLTPYSYAYTSLPPGCTTFNNATLSCTPTSTGTYSVTVTVTDAAGKTASSSTSLTVNSAGVPTITAFSASPNPVTINSATTFSATVTGGVTPYSYAYTGLPAGCTTSNTATLPCTPTVAGYFNVTLKVTDAKLITASKSTGLTVISLPTITAFSASPNPVIVNSATSFSVTVSGGIAPYTYAYAGLPPGCSTSNTATLSCTPSTTGSFNVTVKVTDSNNMNATRTMVLTVNPTSVPTITAFSASPNPVAVNSATSFSVTVSGGTAPYTYAYAGLPTGCSSSNTPTLSCTPTLTGTFSVTVTVTDASSKTATKATTLTVNPASVPTISAFSASPNPTTINTITSFSVTVTGGTTPYSYAYVGLPSGCSTSNTATLSCTPTTAGVYNITVTVTDAVGKTATRSMGLTVNSLLAITAFSASPDPVTVNTATTFSATVSGGTTPYTYTYTGLPAGCASSNTNSLSCTPTATGTFNITVTVTDASGKTASKNTTLTVNSLPAITAFSASPNPVTIGTATTFSATVSGGTTPYAYAYTGLPSGCSSSSTAALSCTPSAAGSFNVTVTVTDANGKTASKNTTLIVNSLPAITAFSASPNPVTIGTATTFSATISGGTTPYAYAYTGLPSGCSSSSTAALSCTPSAAGSFNVTVTVTDANGKTASKNTVLTVNSLPTITSFAASPNPVTVNTATTLSVTLSGGTAPYTYAYSGLPTGCSSANTATLSCTPIGVGNSTVTLTITDAGGNVATKSTTIVVNSAPKIVSFVSSLNPVSVNTATVFTVSVSGGTTPFSYVYTGLPAGCTSSNTQRLSCTPSVTGSFTVKVTATDASGSSTSATMSLVVIGGSSALTITAFSVTPSTVSLSTSTSVSVTVTGGLQPYNYSYAGLPQGCSSQNKASFSCTPSATGVFNITVTVTDARGTVVSKTAVLTVTQSNSNGLLGLAWTSWFAILGLMAAVIAVVAASLILRHRGKRKSALPSHSAQSSGDAPRQQPQPLNQSAPQQGPIGPPPPPPGF